MRTILSARRIARATARGVVGSRAHRFRAVCRTAGRQHPIKGDGKLMPISRLACVRAVALCFASFCSLAILTFGVAGNAAAFLVPLSGKYPYHLAGLGGKATFETVGGSIVTAEKVDAVAAVLSESLLDLQLQFLGAKSSGLKCTNTSSAETILTNLLGHFGASDPGKNSAILLLVPSGFEFTCGGIAKVKIKGAVIGTISGPEENQETEEFTLLFNQTKGKQAYTSFLLGEELRTNQIEEASISGGAFEQVGEQGEPITLKASSGEGKFELDASSIFRIKISKVGKTGTFTVENKTGGKPKLRDLAVEQNPAENWEVESVKLATCRNLTYEPRGMAGSTCAFNVKYIGSVRSLVAGGLEDERGGNTADVFVCSPLLC
jgi:hypothetical protein